MCCQTIPPNLPTGASIWAPRFPAIAAGTATVSLVTLVQRRGKPGWSFALTSNQVFELCDVNAIRNRAPQIHQPRHV